MVVPEIWKNEKERIWLLLYGHLEEINQLDQMLPKEGSNKLLIGK